MSRTLPTATATQNTSSSQGNIFRTALRLIGRGFVEIAQGIRLIAEGTLRPVRSLVPSFVVLAGITSITMATLVLLATTIAQMDLQGHAAHGNDRIWTRWSHSPELRFGDDAIDLDDLVRLTERDRSVEETPETIYVAFEQTNR